MADPNKEPNQTIPNTLRRSGAVLATVGLSALALAGFRQSTAGAAPVERAGITRVEKEMASTRPENSQEALFASTDKGYLEINGRRVFPRFSWNADSSVLPQQRDLGINVFAGVSDPDRQRFTSLLDDQAYYMGQYGENLSGLPNAIGVMADEPDASNVSPDVFTKPPDGQVGAINFTQHFRGDDKNWNMTHYPGYRKKASMFGVDDYLANRYGVFLPGGENKYNYIGLFYDIQKDLVRYADGGMTWQWVETGVVDSESVIKVMKPEWVNIEVGLILAGGAKGIGWWTNTWPDGLVNKFDVSPQNQAVIKALNQQFDRHTELFTSPVVSPPNIEWDNPVKVGVRTIEGQNLNAIIIANASDSDVLVNQPLPRLNGEKLTLLLNNSLDSLMGSGTDSQKSPSTFTAQGKVLKGKLGPYQWVVLEYIPGSRTTKTTEGKPKRPTLSTAGVTVKAVLDDKASKNQIPRRSAKG